MARKPKVQQDDGANTAPDSGFPDDSKALFSAAPVPPDPAELGIAPVLADYIVTRSNIWFSHQGRTLRATPGQVVSLPYAQAETLLSAGLIKAVNP